MNQHLLKCLSYYNLSSAKFNIPKYHLHGLDKNVSFEFNFFMQTKHLLLHSTFQAQSLWSSKILVHENLIEQFEFSTMNMKVSICFFVAILILIFKLLQVAKLRIKVMTLISNQPFHI